MALSCPHTLQRCARSSVPGRHSRISVRAALSSQPSSSEGVQPVPRRKARDLSAKAAGDETLGDSKRAGPLPSTRQTAAQLDVWVEKAVKGPYVAYGRALESHPLLTKALTAFAGFMVGDMLAQHISHPGTWHALRTLRQGMYGLLVDGPVGAKWYDLLDSTVYPEDPRCTKAVLLKTALDQVLYATVMTVVYFSAIKLLEGAPAAIPATVAAKTLPTLVANWAIWPVAHLVSFRFVAPQYRILYNNVIAMGWLTGLSLITHSNWDKLFGLMHR